MIAEIPKFSLISETTATLTHYIHNHVSRLRRLEEPELVAFVDIGHSKTTVSIAKIESVEED